MSPFSAGGDFEIVLLVAGIGLRLAQIPFHAGRAQHRAGDAVFLALVGDQNAHVLQPPHPDPIVGQQFLVFIHFGQEPVAELLDLLLETVVGLVQQPADAEGVGGEPRAAVLLENLERFFALAQAIENRRNGADIEGVRAQPQQMAGDAVQLGEDHAHRLRPRRRFDVEQLLDRQAVAQAVGDRGHVIHAVHIGGELLIGAVFADLLHPAVQVADDALGAVDFLAVELQDHAQHAVGGRMLRTHVDD